MWRWWLKEDERCKGGELMWKLLRAFACIDREAAARPSLLRRADLQLCAGLRWATVQRASLRRAARLDRNKTDSPRTLCGNSGLIESERFTSRCSHKHYRHQADGARPGVTLPLRAFPFTAPSIIPSLTLQQSAQSINLIVLSFAVSCRLLSLF